MRWLTNLFALLVLVATGACGYELDPNLDDYFPCKTTTPQAHCLAGWSCSARGFCIEDASPNCAAYEERDTRCDAHVVEVCRARAWEADQDCDTTGQACVEVASSVVVTFACRNG